MTDTTVRISLKLKQSLVDEIRAYGKSQHHMTDSETFRHLLVSGLREAVGIERLIKSGIESDQGGK